MNDWNGKRVCITGVCGTVGKEVLRQIVPLKPAEIIGLDNNESALFFLDDEFRNEKEINFYLGDMRDRGKLNRILDGIDIVLHIAAFKHVILCEKSPTDAVNTNIIGVQNVIDAAIANNVERVLFTSSDKAVNPTNVMGTSKLMGERLITAANAQQRGGTIFASTRFGNVVGSRGSVIPLFKRQIAQGGPVTLTSRKMTRFSMTLEEAGRLVMDSTFMARGGEVFITKMASIMRIEDLAHVMVQELAPLHGHDPADIEIREIGNKPGEKLYEELINDEETRRTIELEQYFVVLPAFKSVYQNIDYTYDGTVLSRADRPYNSGLEPAMTQTELRSYLYQHRLLDEFGEVDPAEVRHARRPDSSATSVNGHARRAESARVR